MNQHFAIEISTGPATEPVTLAQMRAHLRVTATGDGASPEVFSHPDDSMIEGFTQAAREKVEADTGRALITQTVKQYLDHWPWNGIIYLMRSPVQLTSPETVVITYKDTDGDVQTWATTEYLVDYKSLPPRIVLEHGKSFPDLRGLPGDVIITFPAGYTASPVATPESLISALKLLVGTWYEHRESIEAALTGTGLTPVPMAYDALIAQYKIWDF